MENTLVTACPGSSHIVPAPPLPPGSPSLRSRSSSSPSLGIRSSILPLSPLQWNRSIQKPGAQPYTTDQGSLNTCSTHSLAKCIQAWLDKHGFDLEFQEIYERLVVIHGKDEENCKKSPQEFHNTEVTVEVTAKSNPSSNQSTTIKIEVQTTNTRYYHWEDPKNPMVSSPMDFTAIGCLETPNGNHAVYITSYDPNTWEVETINSHGEGGELGMLNDTTTMIKGGRNEFYQVDLIKLSNVQATNHSQLDQEGHDVPDSALQTAQEEKTQVMKLTEENEQLKLKDSENCLNIEQLNITVEQMKKELEELRSRQNSSSSGGGC